MQINVVKHKNFLFIRSQVKIIILNFKVVHFWNVCKLLELLEDRWNDKTEVLNRPAITWICLINTNRTKDTLDGGHLVSSRTFKPELRLTCCGRQSMAISRTKKESAFWKTNEKAFLLDGAWQIAFGEGRKIKAQIVDNEDSTVFKSHSLASLLTTIGCQHDISRVCGLEKFCWVILNSKMLC